MPISWLRNAIHQATKPKNSIISVLKQNLGGAEPGRSMDVVHASDITQADFCPRKWAFFEIFNKKASQSYISTALDVTFRMGRATEQLVVEEWSGDAAIGNWRCRHCGEQRSMTSKPHPVGYCGATNLGQGLKKHWWEYLQYVINAPEYGVSGAIDCLYNVGSSQLLVTEIKTWNTKEFETIVAPMPEHRLRTNLYMRLIEESQDAYKSKINTQEARVLYVSRGYGKMNATWNEILPFKEHIVKRDDQSLVPYLQRAKALNLFRYEQAMPSGICATATDKIAQSCSVCKECFSGKYPAKMKWESLSV